LVLLLLLTVGATQAQTIYVDTGGNDAFPGTQAQPVRTIQRAITIAEGNSSIETISIEAGTYGNANIGTDADLDGLDFIARVDPTTNATVVQINAITNAADDITFGSAGGAATFSTAVLDLNAGDDASSSFTAVESDLLIRSGGTVQRQVGAAFNGALAFGGAVTVNYDGAGDIAAGGELPASLGDGSLLDVDITGAADDVATLTLSAPLTLAGGDVIVADANAAIDGGLVVTADDVELDGNGNVGDLTVQAAGDATLSTDAGDIDNIGTLVVDEDATVGSIVNGSEDPDDDGTLTFPGVTLTVLGDFANFTADVTAGSIIFAGTEDVTFSGGPNFELNNLEVGDGEDEKLVTFSQDILVNGDFIVEENATADLQAAFVTLAGGSSSAIADGTVISEPGAGAIIFDQDGQTISGAGQFSNIFVAITGGGDVTVSGTDVDFTGTLTLQAGGLDVPGGNDISPMMVEGEDEPSVFVNVEGAGTDITGAGTFNAADNAYDLTYFGDGSATAALEFDTEFINDLFVNVSGAVDAAGADEDGTIDGMVTIADGTLIVDAAIVIDGMLTVDADGALNSTAMSVTLNADSDVDGDVSGLLILSDDVTVTGASDTEVPSEIENVQVADDAEATITGLNEITGMITFADAAGAILNLGLTTDDPDTGDMEGLVTGDITLQGNTLNLISDIVAGGNVSVGEGGLLALGDNDLELDLDGALLSANADGEITAGTGAVIFADANQAIDLNGGTIANVVLDGSDDVSVNSDLVIDGMFTQMAITDYLLAGANAVTLSGTADIAGGAFFVGAEVNVEDLTIMLEEDATIVAAVVQDGGLTLVGDDDDTPPNDENLTVTGIYTQESGELALNDSDLILTTENLAYDYNDGSVTADSGALVFECEFGGPPVPPLPDLAGRGGCFQEYNLASALTIPNVVVDNDRLTDADADDDSEDLTIGQSIALVAGVVDVDDATDDDADQDIAIASGATIIRWAGSFQTAPEFPGDGSLTVQYGDAGTAFSGTIETDVELPDAVMRLIAYDNVNLNKVVTVSEEFLVADDFNDSETDLPDTDVRVILEALAELTLSGEADIIDGDPINADDDEIEFLGMYDLTYLDYLIEATGQELTDMVRTLTIDQGAPSAQVIVLAANNVTVQNLFVEDGTFYFNGLRLNVDQEVQLAEAGSLANSFQNNTRGGQSFAALAFTGDTQGTFDLADDFNVPNGLDLMIMKDAFQNEEGDTLRVMVQDGSIIFDDVAEGDNDETLWLGAGILVIPDGEYIRLDHENTLEATTTRDDGQGFIFPDDELFPDSWIYGEIRKNIVSIMGGDELDPGRVEFPTGADQYAEFTLDFEAYQDQQFGQRTIGVKYVAMQPLGGNFPDTEDNLGSADFYWNVTSDVPLSSQTRFNVEARNDSFDLEVVDAVEELRLLRRQADDVDNPYTIAGADYDNFLLDPTPSAPNSGDEEPVVVAQNARAGFGPFGTVFTYGVPDAVAPATVQVQVIHAAPTAPSPVDIYVDGSLAVDDLSYKSATEYIGLSITGTQEIAIAVAPGNSTGAGDAVLSDTLEVTEGQSFVIIAADDGVDENEGDPVDLIVEMTEGPDTGSDQVEVIPAHVSPDAPAVDLRLTGTDFYFAQNIAYGEVAEGSTIDAAEFAISLLPAGEDEEGGRILAEEFDFGPYAGDRGILIVGGLVDSSPSQPTRALDMYFVTPEGEIVQGELIPPVANEDDETVLPTAFNLNGAYPNPFNRQAQVSFDLPEAANVSLALYDMLGRQVLDVDEPMAAGSSRSIAIDGAALTSGVYVFQLRVESGETTHVETGRITVVH
jgi:hypothetical protein